jgi:hypothetical protein
MSNEQHYWFVRKRLGLGWRPNTKEGYAVALGGDLFPRCEMLHVVIEADKLHHGDVKRDTEIR